MKLHPVKFKYTEEWKRRHPSLDPNRYYYNYIAQEYREVFPESVKGSGEFLETDTAHTSEVLQMEAYNSQIVAIKAIQELKKMVDDLNAKNNALEFKMENLLSENKNLKTDNEKIKAYLELSVKGAKAEK